MNKDLSPNPFFKTSSGIATHRLHPLWWGLMVVVFLVGLAVRLYELTNPPLDFHPTRQLHSALIARGMYAAQTNKMPAWQRDEAIAQWQMEGHIEPQVFERVTAWGYRLLGGPDLRLPRVIAILSWMIAAVFIVWLALDLTGPGGALIAGCFFLVWPYGVIASRAFQPEPIALMLAVVGLWAGARWEQHSGWKWTLAAGLLCGGAIFIKVVLAFFLGPALLTLAVSRNGWRRFPGAQIWVMAALAVIPYAVYHIYGMYIDDFLMAQFSQRFFPEMWIDPAFYLRWLNNLGRVLPFEMTLTALVGSLLLQKAIYRGMGLALWIGYFLYGIALPHHISTHDYYHLLLFPALSIGLAGVGELVFTHLPLRVSMARTVAALAVLALLAVNGYSARTALKRFDGYAQADVWQQIGAQLGHEALVVALVPDYGVGLKYWAWINPYIWPTVDDIRYRQETGESVDFTGLFDELVVGRQYFVVSPLGGLEEQPQLKSYLFAKHPVLIQTSQYIIFDLRSEVK